MALTSPGLIKGANEVLISLVPELNIIKLFAYDCSDAVEDYGAKVRIPFATGGTAEQFNLASSPAADYEHETGSLSDCFVTLNQQPKATIGITGMDVLELANAPYWNRFKDACANSVKESLSNTTASLFTDTNVPTNVTAPDEFTLKNVAKLRAACNGRVSDNVLLLEPIAFAELLGNLDACKYGDVDPIQYGVIKNLLGFAAVGQLNGLTAEQTAAGIRGALVPRNEIAFANRGIAVGDPTPYSELGNVTDPETGLTLTVMRHGAARTGKGYINVTTLFGATFTNAIAAKRKVKLIKDADEP